METESILPQSLGTVNPNNKVPCPNLGNREGVHPVGFRAMASAKHKKKEMKEEMKEEMLLNSAEYHGALVACRVFV